jgi:cytochrome c oxidase cbb3-type subunit 3
MAREDVARGMRQFQQSCGMCHGSEAKGGSGPNLIDSSLVRHDDNGNLIGKVIREGRPERGMPVFASFTDNQVMDIVTFLHAAIEASDNRSAAGPAGGYSLKRLLTGNAQAGKQFFNGEGGCATCHSISGDLAGIAKKYSPVELEGRILYPPVKTKTGVVTLPSGEKVNGEVLHLDVFYVAIRDAKGHYRSWPLGTGVKVELADPLHGHLELLSSYKDKDIHDVFAYLETLQ